MSACGSLEAISLLSELLFNSESYLLFLPLVVLLNWRLPAAWRPAFLLAASYVFYAAWNPPFLFLVGGLTVANYLVGLAQGRRGGGSGRLLLLALAVDLGALAIFKYL